MQTMQGRFSGRLKPAGQQPATDQAPGKSLSIRIHHCLKKRL